MDEDYIGSEYNAIINSITPKLLQLLGKPENCTGCLCMGASLSLSFPIRARSYVINIEQSTAIF